MAMLGSSAMARVKYFMPLQLPEAPYIRVPLPVSPIGEDSTLWLRLDREADRILIRYSIDGSNFCLLCEVAL